MKTEETQLQHLLALSTEMGLEIKEEWTAGVLTHLQNAKRMADILYQAPIANNDLALANVFRPDGLVVSEGSKK
ncbi:DUF4089 domain-containing protein [Teredinibacter turnerae]|uniref:Uncharacterized protein n=1 Tax=Teredinibacter turnerae (strain ATCC 39867 / T7901) TaxID=377629 RepID=C5BIN7_TERTT|nr:DUF4089 domain-containing protein [Teredinibacter turnerae]ACR11126.1 hypothetical protein TERTU_2009 [Teredinibacter turnerae T7901]